MNRTRLLSVALGAVVLAGAVIALRSGVEAPGPPVQAPDGEQIRAFHDVAFVEPPTRTQEPPAPPGALRTDARLRGALVSWPATRHGFEVRWGRSGGPLDGRRYVATSSTTLTDLEPGRYRVEVRAVDDIGRRSEPTATDVEVGDGAPQWQQGLGFVRDFTDGADVDRDAFLVYDEDQGCITRDGKRGPLMLGQCFSQLRPTSPLVLSEPDASGVRGRVVVVSDAPPTGREARRVADEDRDRELGNELLVSVGPNPFFGQDTVVLRVGMTSSYLLNGVDRFDDGAHNRLDQDVVIGPGTQHRWELAFTGTEVRVSRDGTQVGAYPFRPEWTRTTVAVSGFVMPEAVPDFSPRLSLLGLTGPAPDGRPTELVRTRPRGVEPTDRFTVDLAAAPTAETVRVHGYIGPPGTWDSPDAPPPAPDVVAELGGRQVPVRRTTGAITDEVGYGFEAELPADVARAGGPLVLRSVDGRQFSLYEANLEIEHEHGTDLPMPPTRVVAPPTQRLPTPDLIVTRGEYTIISGQRLRPDEVRVEVDAAGAAAATQPIGGGLVGWVAVRVELDGQRILDIPTAVDGPAVAGKYTFTLKLGRLRNTSKDLTVTLVPDRQGVARSSERFTVRVED